MQTEGASCKACSAVGMGDSNEADDGGEDMAVRRKLDADGLRI